MSRDHISGNLITAIIVLVISLSIMLPMNSNAQQFTHKVQKGETLWSICEKYYGNPDLWPKLWQMNPFITNPHFLNPGDVITLIEKAPAAETEAPIDKPKEAVMEEIKVESEPLVTGIDVSRLVNIDTLGYFTVDKLTPVGKIISAESSRVVLSEGDIAYIQIDNIKDIKIGDKFTVCESITPVYHPLTKASVGYAASFSGKLIIKELHKKYLYKTEIVDTVKPVNIGDFIIPYHPVSPCIQPMPAKKAMEARIISVKDQKELIGLNTVVYLDIGFNQGARRGNIFNVIKKVEKKNPEYSFKKLEYLNDPQNPKKKVSFETIIGNLLILESRPDTSTAMVLTSKTNFDKGAITRNSSWIEKPSFLSSLPTCPVK